MIRHFRCDETADLFRGQQSRRWSSILRVALRKLDQLNQAAELADLRVPPGNRLEPLTGNREGQHSIRINAQWRICFRWYERNAYDVEIVDYH